MHFEVKNNLFCSAVYWVIIILIKDLGACRRIIMIDHDLMIVLLIHIASYDVADFM